MLEVEPTGRQSPHGLQTPEVFEPATKLSPMPLHMQSLGGCTVDASNCHLQGHIV